MNDENYLIQDDTAEQWKSDHPEEYAELEKKFQEMYGKNEID